MTVRLYDFNDITVKRIDAGDFPDFEVSGIEGDREIKFTVVCYDHSSWTFRKRSLGIVPINARKIRMAKGMCKATSTIIIPVSVL